jgi:undecaprenyl-diphosphatase
MTIIEAIILGIIQGATEFLPISSSGHSILIPTILGLHDPSLNAVIIAHEGTLLAVLIYFRKQLIEIGQGVLRGLASGKPLSNPDARLGWYLVVGSIPAAVIGLLFEQAFETRFATPRYAAAFLLVTALFLLLGERLLSGEKKLDRMTWFDAIFIGMFQMFALFPGVSRSGSTIVAGLLRGLNRELAARYSFLMSIPVIAGAGLLGVKDLIQEGNLMAQLPSLMVVFATAAIVGYGCITFLLNWLRQRSLYPFAIYCALFGTLYLVVDLLR